MDPMSFMSSYGWLKRINLELIFHEKKERGLSLQDTFLKDKRLAIGGKRSDWPGKHFHQQEITASVGNCL